MMSSLSSPSALTSSLQEKLDAAVQSPHAFSKLVDKLSSTAAPTMSLMNGSLSAVNPRSLSSRSSQESDNNKAEDFVDVKTNYRDYSRFLPEDKDVASSILNQASTTKEPTFPVKLHKILSNPEFQDIISWLPHGEFFVAQSLVQSSQHKLCQRDN